MGVCIIVRDHTSSVRVAMCTTKRHVTNSTIAKAYAVQQGVEKCRDLGIQYILLEDLGRLTLYGMTEMKLPTR